MKRIMLSIVLTLAFAACDKKQSPRYQNADAKAKASIAESFSVTPTSAPSDLNVDKANIVIQKSALEKEFLLQANLMPQETLPTFGGLQSRVVFFRQVENKVYLIEASRGLLLPKDYPVTLPIAEFEVLKEDASALTLDFNKGMSRLFVADDWHSRDGGSRSRYASVKTAFSYISRAGLTTNNRLEIRQTALIEMGSQGMNSNMPVEVAYYLSPYQPNAAFTPTVAPGKLDRMGFFEVASQFNDQGGFTSYAAKMDISKPVVYAISSNTPPEFHDAIREGILYWNKAFGREVMKVVDAPAGMRAPQPDYNIVQWVEADMAGFAFADAQMDPRTGEIQHQQIYFSSGWRRAARGEFEDYFKLGRIMHRPKLGLNGFKSNTLCDMDINAQVAAEFSRLSLTEQDSTKALKAAADLLREVVAHEVGHTLGLRHNFAASLAANYSLDKREAIFKNYLDSGSAPADLRTASSAMDYQYPVEGALSGDQMLKLPQAFEYDEKAIRTLYFGQQYNPTELPLFCTDSHVEQFVDCKPYDAGNSFVEWMKYSARHNLDDVPTQMIKAFIQAKAPSFGGEARDVSAVSIEPRIIALTTTAGLSSLVTLMHRDQRLLSVARKHSYLNSSNEADVRRETIEILTADLARQGQFEKVMLPTTMDVVSGLREKYEALLNDPKVIRGVTYEGKSYEFTAEELRTMKEMGQAFFKRLRTELARVEIQVLNGEDPIAQYFKEVLQFDMGSPSTEPMDMNDLTMTFATYLEKRAEDLVMGTEGDPAVFRHNVASEWNLPPGSKSQVVGGPEVISLTLPRFAYNLELRKKAAGMLRSDRAESPAWGYAQRIALGNAYESMVGTALPGVSVKDSGTVQNYPSDVTRWILESREVRAAINKP